MRLKTIVSSILRSHIYAAKSLFPTTYSRAVNATRSTWNIANAQCPFSITDFIETRQVYWGPEMFFREPVGFAQINRIAPDICFFQIEVARVQMKEHDKEVHVRKREGLQRASEEAKRDVPKQEAMDEGKGWFRWARTRTFIEDLVIVLMLWFGGMQLFA